MTHGIISEYNLCSLTPCRCSKAKLLTLGCGEGWRLLQAPSKENRQLMLKRLELLDGFQGKALEVCRLRVEAEPQQQGVRAASVTYTQLMTTSDT